MRKCEGPSYSRALPTRLLPGRVAGFASDGTDDDDSSSDKDSENRKDYQECGQTRHVEASGFDHGP